MLTNNQLFNQLIGVYGSNEKQTNPAAIEHLKSIGYDGLKYADIKTQAEWAALTLQFELINLQVGSVKNPFEAHSFGESFGLEHGGLAQKILINPVSTNKAPYVGLKDGDSPDQFKYFDSTVNERFWKQNFDYSAAISIRDDFFRKQVFSNDYGMNLLVQGQMTALQNCFSEQQYWNTVEKLNAILNDTNSPLKDTQKVGVTLSDNPTDEEILAFAKVIRKVIKAMCDLGPATDAFNSFGFRTTQDKNSLHLIVRPGYTTDLEFTKPILNHYPTDPLEGLDIIEVENFGGLQYFSDEAHQNRIYPAVDSNGRKLANQWSTTSDGLTITTPENVYTVDPNENVIAMLADTGVVFDCQQNPYSVEPVRNAAGCYTTYWARRPNELLGIDFAHNVVAFYKNGATV